jgi:polypeptide N-acetylgalactosaminyltransferase
MEVKVLNTIKMINFPGWLEPLLDRLVVSQTVAVIPIIDIISEANFHYSMGSVEMIGRFHLSKLLFDWASVPIHEKKRRAKLGPLALVPIR